MDSADSGSLDDSASTVDLNQGRSSNLGPRPKLEVLDNFQIESELGHGGMGEVYLATERGLNRQVALKVLPAASRISSKQVQRFLLEAKAAAQLSHDHIVPIYHVGECGGVHYFTMRYIEGYDLAQIIRSGQRAMRELSDGSVDTQSPSDYKPKSKSSKPNDSTAKDRADSTHGLIDFSTSSFVGSLRASGSRSAHKLAVSVALIGQAVADALQHAHEHGIVHRDIKPSNLMLDNSNKVWVTDFGLAQLQDSGGLTNTGEMLGTLRYMSPEQASARPTFIDHRTDIYSLGVTLYELATLQRACRGDSAQEILRSITFERPQPIRKINPKLPRDLETIIFKATERNPSDRYQTAAEMAADLRRFANSEALIARRPSRLKGIRNWIWDRPAVSAMALGMLLVFAGAMLAVVMANQGRADAEKARADENERALSISEGKQLQSVAVLLKDSNPGLGVAAGVAGAMAAPSSFANRALMAAVDRNHEVKTIPVAMDFPGQCVVSESGSRLLLCASAQGLGKTRQKSPIVELGSGAVVASLDGSSLITSAAFINSDKHILTFSPGMGSADEDQSQPQVGEIRVWSGNTFELIKSVGCNEQSRVSSRNYSQPTHRLAVPNASNSVTVFDLPTFNQVLVLPVSHTQAVVECVYNSDGTQIATWSMDGVASVFDAENGQELHRVEIPMQRTSDGRIFFTSDSKQLCVTGDSGTHFIDLLKKSVVGKRFERIVSASTKHSLVILLERARQSIIVFNPESQVAIADYKVEGFISDALLVDDDRYVALVTDEKIVVIDTKTGQHVSDLRGHQSDIVGLAAVPGRSQLVSLAWDDTVRAWEVRSDLERRAFATRFLPLSPVLATQSEHGSQGLIGTVRVSQTALRTINSLSEQVKAEVEGELLLVGRDGRVVTATDQGIALWDMKTQRRTHFAALPDLSKTHISQTIEIPAIRQFAILTHEGELLFWAPEKNLLSRHAKKPSERIKAIALRDRGTELLIGLSTGELASLDVINWHRSSITHLSRTIKAMEVHSEKPWLLIASDRNSAFIWNFEKAQIGTEFTKPAVLIDQASFVGDRVVTHGGIGSKSVNVWDAESGEELDAWELQHVFKMVVDESKAAFGVICQAGAMHWDLESSLKSVITSDACTSIAFVGQQLVVAVGTTQPLDASKNIPRDRHRLCVWNTVDHELVSSVQCQQHISRILATDEAGSFVTTGFTFGADYFDSEAIQPRSRLKGHLEPLLLADFGATEKQAITVASDGVVLVHPLETTQAKILTTNDYPITAATITNDKQILLFADREFGVRQWNLISGTWVRDITMGKKHVSRIVVSANDHFAIAVVDGRQIKHWDLRNGSVTDFEFESGIRNVALSPDGQTIFVAEGSFPIFPAHPLVAAESNLGQPATAMLIQMTTDGRTILELDGLAVGGQFVDTGKKLAILTTTGKVHLFDASTHQLMHSIVGSRRIMQLLQGPADSTSVYTAARDGVCIWSSTDGKLENHIPTNLTEYDAAVTTPNIFRSFKSNSDYWVFSGDHYIRRPVDVVAYAKKIAPRLLSEEERSQLLEETLR